MRRERGTKCLLFCNKLIEELTDRPECLQPAYTHHFPRLQPQLAGSSLHNKHLVWTFGTHFYLSSLVLLLLLHPAFPLQALGFPGDDLTAVPWQRPRCNEGPLFLLSSQLPAPLLIIQNLSSTFLPILRCHHHAGVIAVRVFTLQTSALLPPDRASSYCQHAAAEAQLALPEPCRCYCRTPSNRRRSKRFWGLTSGSRKPASRATWRTWRRWDGHQHGKPKRWCRWNY